MSTIYPRDFVLKYSPKVGRILDAGCGDCYYAQTGNTINKNIVCLDITNPAISCLKEHPFIQGSIGNLPFKNESFECIYCFSVIELFEDDRQVIKEFFRVLKPGGTLILTVPTKNSIFRYLRDLEIKYEVYNYPDYILDHYHYYSQCDLENLIDGYFSMEELTGYQFSFFRRSAEFLLKIFGLYNPLRDIKANIVGNQKKKTVARQTNRSAPSNNPQKKKIISNLRSRFNTIFSDFSYHYIIILRKGE